MKIYFFNNLILRTPKFPCAESITYDDINEAIKNPIFQEGIFLSSSVLFNELKKVEDVKNERIKSKLKRSIYKYLIRSHYRPTPFGLFANSGCLSWGSKTEIKFDCDNDTRHSRLDMYYLKSLISKLNKILPLRDELSFYPNSTIQYKQGKIRFTEYYYIGDKKKYKVVEVVLTKPLTLILSALEKCSLSFKELTHILFKRGISENDAIEFVSTLIDYQILFSELDINVTGLEPLDEMISLIEKKRADDPRIIKTLGLLDKIQKEFKTVDEIEQKSPLYSEIISTLESLGITQNAKSLVQVDSYRDFGDSMLDSKISESMSKAITVLSKLGSHWTNKRMEAFKTSFLLRYEAQEICLLDVLDGESGIGYGQNNTTSESNLIDGLILTSAEDRGLNWSATQSFLLEKLINCIRQGNSELILTAEDFKHLPDNKNIPKFISLIFSLYHNETPYLRSIWGGMSTSLLARFGSGNSDILKIVEEISELECSQNANAIIAEIVYLPDDRLGNILFRPVLSEYEIPILCKSTLSDDKRLSLSDLYVSILNGRIRLRSKRLNKFIIPRLSSAHNYNVNSLPIYQFLCDLQGQNEASNLTFDWGALSASPYLPRVTVEKCIVSLATWNVHSTSLEQAIKAGSDLLTSIRLWRRELGMPQHVIISDGDNHVPVDLEIEDSISLLVHELKKNKALSLKEFLGHTCNIVKDNLGRNYVNEFVTVAHTDSTYNSPKPNLAAEENNCNRKFYPGSEWLYFKIYCGYKTADVILRTIYSLCQTLKELMLIEKWFFIRYKDSDNHIRLRVLSTADIAEVSKLILEGLKVHESEIPRISIDTYERELERYGGTFIEESEELFYYDSECTLNLIQQTDLDSYSVRWLYVLKMIDIQFTSFEVPLQNRIEILNELKSNALKKYSNNNILNRQMSDRYRNYKDVISKYLESAFENEVGIIFSDYQANLQMLYRKMGLKIANQHVSELFALLPSYLHMSINRMLIDNQNEHELLFYDFMIRYYNTKLLRKN